MPFSHVYHNVWFIALLLYSINSHAQKHQSAIHIIKKNDLSTAKKFFNKSNVNTADKEGDNLLMNTALYGSVNMMELLLKKGADPNLKNMEGETALMWSLYDMEKVKLLLRSGADINIKSRSGNTAFLIASVGANQYEILRLLMEYGANPLDRNGKKETALSRAAIFGDTSTLSLLLSTGIDIEGADTSGLTPLIQSIFNVNREGTIFLLNKGANPDRVAAFGLTAVTAVVTYNDLESVNAVLKKSKNINTVDDLGISALMWAAYNEHDNPEIMQALLNSGADINIKAKNGDTALTWAIKKGNTQTVALLKKAGAQ